MNRRLVTAVFLLFPLASVEAAGVRAGDPLQERLEPLGWELTEKHRVPGVAIACIRAGALAWTCCGAGAGHEPCVGACGGAQRSSE